MGKKRIFIYFIIGMLLLSICLCYKVDLKAQDGTLSIPITKYILQDTVIEKKFVAEKNNLYKISLTFATYEKVNSTGILNVKILDEQNYELYNKDIAVKDLKDNTSYTFEFNKQKDSKNKEYKIIIYGKNIPKETSLTILGYNKTNNLFINNKLQDVDCFTIYTYKGISYNLILYFFVYISIVFILELFRKK